MFNQFMFGPQSIPNANGPMLAEKPGMFSGILSKLNPFPAGLSQDAGNARAEALMMAGFGMLAGNQGNYGAAFPAIAQGGMQGLQAYRNSLKEQAARRQAMLQERLINSQIGENDAQTEKRKADLARTKKMELDRQTLIKTLDQELGQGAQEMSIGGDRGPSADGSISAPQVNISAQPYWGDTVEGNREASRRAQLMGNQELAMEYWKRSQDIVDAELKREQINKERRPEQKLTVGSPTGGNEQYDYVLDLTGKIPGQRLQADPRYVLAGKRQAVSNTTVNNIPAKVQEAGQVEMAKKDSAYVDELRKKRADASLILPVLTRMEKATKDGRTYSGTFAEFKTGIGKMLNSIGLPGVNIDKIASSEQYAADQAEVIRTKIKALGSGTGVSNVDLLFTQRSVPELVKTPEGRLQIIKAMKADLQNIIDDADSANKHFRDNKGSLGGWEPPSAKKNAVIQDDDVEDIIRRNLK